MVVDLKAKAARRSRRVRKTKRSRNILLYVVMLIVTFYVLFLMVDLQIRISNAKTELSQIEERIFTQEQTNKELKKVSDAVEKNDDKAFSDYVEKIAREDLDYVKNGEVVFVNIAGD